MSTGVGLVADIGRHSVRFALTGGPEGLQPRESHHYSTADYPTFTNALVGYLDRVGLARGRLPSALAIAGMTRGDVVNITGSRWFVSLSGIQAVLGARPQALNECAATALALVSLDAGDFSALSGPPVAAIRPGGNYLVISPGTGLGVAALLTHGNRLVPIQTEAGHANFPARTAAERQIVDHLRARGTIASNESLLSAVGLQHCYAALSPPGAQVPRSEAITRMANGDRVAASVIATFVEALGGMIGDHILAYGAWDGVFLTGALARALAPHLAHPSLRRRLEEKDAFRRQLAQVPVAVVRRSALELLGAATALAQAA